MKVNLELFVMFGTRNNGQLSLIYIHTSYQAPILLLIHIQTHTQSGK